MTYIGIGKNQLSALKTLVLAKNDEEAREKIMSKFCSWWGGDCREEDILIRAFAEAQPALS